MKSESESVSLWSESLRSAKEESTEKVLVQRRLAASCEARECSRGRWDVLVQPTLDLTHGFEAA